MRHLVKVVRCAVVLSLGASQAPAQQIVRVGDEFITRSELEAAVKERIDRLPGGYKPNRTELKELTALVLEMLIDKSTIVQEAKRELGKPAVVKMLFDFADRVWRDEELPPLLRTMAAENESELKEKLAGQGRSLEAMRATYREEFLARGFLEQKLKDKIKVTDAELCDYYEAHRSDYNCPEQWTGREVLIEVANHPSRAAARSKAEAILARIRRGDDFAAVAQAESEGPNRAAGGRWETARGGFAVAAVNQTLESLPLGQSSAIIEGPSSYHIIRIEARRPDARPPFVDVQAEVRRIVRHQKVERVSNEYLDALRRQYVVTRFIDDPVDADVEP